MFGLLVCGCELVSKNRGQRKVRSNFAQGGNGCHSWPLEELGTGESGSRTASVRALAQSLKPFIFRPPDTALLKRYRLIEMNLLRCGIFYVYIPLPSVRKKSTRAALVRDIK